MSILETEREEGREEGRKECREELEAGLERGREKVARKMHSDGFDLEAISRYAEYSLEALQALLFPKPSR